MDGSSVVYVANSDSGLVYKEIPNAGGYTQQGPIGSSLQSAFALAVDPSGNVYIVDSWANVVYKETLSSSGYTQSVLGRMTIPTSIAIDVTGNVYILATPGADTTVLYKEMPTSSGYLQSTILTDGTGAYSGLAVDGSGNLFFSFTGSQCVERDRNLWRLCAKSLVASGLGEPQNLAVDGNGNVYVADTLNAVILKETWTGSGYTQSTVANAGEGLSQPNAVAIDGENIYIADSGSGRVLKENLASPPSLSFASTSDGTTTVSSSSATETVQNAGNAALDLPVPSVGNNPSLTGNLLALSTAPGPMPCPIHL